MGRQLCRGGVGAAMVSLAVASATDAGDPSIAPIHDWLYNEFVDPADEGVIPVPFPANLTPPGGKVIQELHTTVTNMGLPFGILMFAGTAPTEHAILDPEALPTVLSWVPSLDYVYCDFEDQYRELAMLNVIDLVRNHPNPAVNSALIGNYAYYPGNWDYSVPFPEDAQRILRSWFYLGNDMTVAMPHLYPFSIYEAHTLSEYWGADTAPNTRAAMFWAPIERISVAKRDLPEGDLLVPWVNPGVPSGAGWSEPLPPREDWFTILMHFRMRGADGYFTWLTLMPEYPNDLYRRDLVRVWETMDCLIDGSGVELLNLETDKGSGLQWSGVRNGNNFAFIVSNLGEAPGAADFVDSWPGVPNSSPTLQPGEHRLLTYPAGALGPCVGDCDNNGWPDAIDIAVSPEIDCNDDGVPDACSSGADCDNNGVPDDCDPDCNVNGTPDACDITSGTSGDCDGNHVPDSCDIASGAADCNANGTPDSCETASADCNSNGVPDDCDIDGGGSNDVNRNGVPDDCEEVPCPSDVNLDGSVDADDLVTVVIEWGSDDFSADITGDGIVDVDDLVEIILAWGACP